MNLLTLIQIHVFMLEIMNYMFHLSLAIAANSAEYNLNIIKIYRIFGLKCCSKRNNKRTGSPNGHIIAIRVLSKFQHGVPSEEVDSFCRLGHCTRRFYLSSYLKKSKRHIEFRI